MPTRVSRRRPKKRLVNPVKVSTQLEKSYLDMLSAYCEEHHIPLTEGFARAIEKLVQPEGGRVTALASEQALIKIWDTPEEDEAWQHL